MVITTMFTYIVVGDETDFHFRRLVKFIVVTPQKDSEKI